VFNKRRQKLAQKVDALKQAGKQEPENPTTGALVDVAVVKPDRRLRSKRLATIKSKSSKKQDVRVQEKEKGPLSLSQLSKNFIAEAAQKNGASKVEIWSNKYDDDDDDAVKCETSTTPTPVATPVVEVKPPVAPPSWMFWSDAPAKAPPAEPVVAPKSPPRALASAVVAPVAAPAIVRIWSNKYDADDDDDEPATTSASPATPPKGSAPVVRAPAAASPLIEVKPPVAPPSWMFWSDAPPKAPSAEPVVATKSPPRASAPVVLAHVAPAAPALEVKPPLAPPSWMFWSDEPANSPPTKTEAVLKTSPTVSEPAVAAPVAGPATSPRAPVAAAPVTPPRAPIAAAPVTPPRAPVPVTPPRAPVAAAPVTPPRAPVAAAPVTPPRSPVATTAAVKFRTSTPSVVVPPGLRDRSSKRSVPAPVVVSDADDDSSEEDDDILADMDSDDEEELLNTYILTKTPSWDEYLFPEPKYRFCGVCF
jgi:hypothetical protein